MSGPDAHGDPALEQRLGLVLRGVQRMADGLGSIEAKLPDLASADRLKALSDRVDEYRVRSRSEVAQIGDVVTALAHAVEVVMREQQALAETVRSAPAGEAADAGAIERLTDAVRGLRDDLAESHLVLQAQTEAVVERVAGEQAERAMRLHEAVGEAGQRTAATVVASIRSGDDVGQLAEDVRQLRQALDGRHVVVTEAIAAIRQDLAAAVDELRTATATTTERAPVVAHDDSDVRADLAEIRVDLRRLQGDVAAAAGQVRTDVAAQQAQLRDELVAAVAARLAEPVPPLESARPSELAGVYDRLGGIEWRLGERLDPLGAQITALERRIEALQQSGAMVPAPAIPSSDPRVLARLASLEAGLEQVVQRDDLRRGVDRVLGAVSSAEQAVSGEVRAVDARVGAIADEVRLVRVLRDGLDALADGIDGVRQLASRTATSQQMTEITRELSVVLSEIEVARSQVLRVEQSTSPVAAEVVAVGSDVDDLSRRIDQLAEVIEDRVATGGPGTEVAQRLRQMSESARQLGNGVLEDLRARRKR